MNLFLNLSAVALIAFGIYISINYGSYGYILCMLGGFILEHVAWKAGQYDKIKNNTKENNKDWD